MIHNDHLGTPQKMTDAAGVIRWSADYKPFGEVNIITSDITNNLRFPGEYYDIETGLHYNYFRDSNPATGSFLEADPIGILSGTNHLYVRVGNNPVKWYDPWGLQGAVMTPSGPMPIYIPIVPRATPQEQQQAIENLWNLFNPGPLYNYLREGGIGSWVYDITHSDTVDGGAVAIWMGQHGWQNIENEYTRRAQLEPDPCQWLKEEYNNATDSATRMKIKTAQKKFGCRDNRQRKDKCK